MSDSTAVPQIFDASVPADASALAELRRASTPIELDTLAQQLADLAQARNPDRRLGHDESVAAVATVRGSVPASSYGRHVYFPWSNQLVRLLPPREFAELRFDRNRGKISREEGARLAGSCVAVAGLSVGLAIATTLAMEGVGGTFHLADFDELGLSNLNRLLGSVAELGVPKVQLAARRLYELNPYVRVRLFPQGVQDDNVDEFLGGASLLIEECDSLPMKIRLRERARAARMPVLMETSDRGMLDVERFDHLPDRPLLHGLFDGLRAEDAARLTPAERMALVLQILGPTLSPKMAQALLEVGRTQETWPQLASGVVLGGATATHAARLILLGQPLLSGRYFIDLDQLLGAPAECS